MISPKRHKDPIHYRNILFIEAQGGWGDYLYYCGLLNQIHKYEISIDVAVLDKATTRYQLPYIHKIYSLESKNNIHSTDLTKYDLLIDATYVNANYWPQRVPFIKKADCYSITCGNLAQHSNLFDEYLDLSIKSHTSQRMALIFNRICHQNINKILPKATILGSLPENLAELCLNSTPKIYINTIAGDIDRCLSEEQIWTLVNIFKSQTKFEGIINTDLNINSSPYLKILPSCSFEELTTFLSKCSAIITPDTSIVHAGTVLNIPVLAFFCGNDIDYFSKYSMADVWKPLSYNSIIYETPNTNNSNRKVIPISSLSSKNLKIVVEKFLLSLQ